MGWVYAVSYAKNGNFPFFNIKIEDIKKELICIKSQEISQLTIAGLDLEGNLVHMRSQVISTRLLMVIFRLAQDSATYNATHHKGQDNLVDEAFHCY